MKEIERLMVENIVEDLNGLQDLELGTEEHRMAVDTTDKQFKDLLEIEKLRIQSEELKLKREAELKWRQIELEEKRREQKVKNAIAVGGVVATCVTTVTVAGLYLVYDTTGNIPSPFVKKIVDNASKFLLKF